MANLEMNNIVENIVDTQKKVVETVVENTKKFTSGNNLLNDSIEKGSEWYKNWLETQKSFFNQSTEKANATTEKVKESTNKMGEFYENYATMQKNWAKQVWDMNQDLVKGMTNNMSANPYVNWQNNFNNMNNNMNNWMSNMSPANWMNNSSNYNPFNVDGMKKASENWTNVMGQFYNMLNGSFADMQRSLSGSTVQDAYKNMINVGEGFTKFAEVWMPMLRSVSDKSFNMDVYRQMVSPELYKDLMDKYFGFMPEANRSYIQNMMSMMNDSARQFGTTGMNGYRQMRNMAGMSGNVHAMFDSMSSTYQNMYSSMNEAFAPFTRIITPTQHTKAMAEWADLSQRIAAYNIKNAELQYMIYVQGGQVMDALAENVAEKVRDGKEVNSIVSLYQEWLNISDKEFVKLFESAKYSELMAEVGSMQMKLKKDIEGQMEKSLANVPVATRSEMDELYKAIYDLKSQVRQLQSMMELSENSTEVEENGTPKTRRTKAN
jgi:polyhydroxyalkanoate synthase subunit PhaE